jgi:hypothetical protein
LKADVDVKAANNTAMRALAFSGLLLLARAALAQDEAGAVTGDCNVISRPIDVNERGEIVQPPPSPEDCAAATDLLDKFLAMDRRDFQRIVERKPTPGNVRTEIGRRAPFGRVWTPYDIESLLPDHEHIVTYESDSIVVIVYESSDFTGDVLSVLVADMTTLKACNFPRWPETRDPRSLSVDDIQAILDPGLAGDRPTPVCYLKPLIIE